MLARFASERVVIDAAERRRTIESIIDSATTRLCLSVYRFDDPQILSALARARRRGVSVEILMSPVVKGGRRQQRLLRAAFEGAGFQVAGYAAPVKYHAKYLVADDRRAVIGSLNLTRKCLTRTCDFLVVSSDPEVVGGVAELFRCDRADIPLSALPPQLIVGPDRTRTAYADLIRSARTRIRVLDHKLSDPWILDLLARTSRKGIDVDVVGDARPGPRAHGKLVIIDDRLAVIGSVALSTASLDFRRELAIVVRTPRPVAALVRYFDGLRASGPVPHTQSDMVACEAI